ncbi:MAG TPA: O-antigen ligase family protein [Candidatus Kapabacteria bacterium]|nr:O-antigen ligase family protein [Candidatus Kapabacteria bacterium]
MLLGGGVAASLLWSFLITHSLLPIAAILGLVMMWVILRDPLYSIIGFMVINVIITLRPQADTIGSAPTMFDMILGLGLTAIIGYWIFKIRILEWRSLSVSAGQLSLMLFFVWAVFVTIGGIIFNNNPATVALRELLNLLPLLILPVLYVRFITPGSKAENWIFAGVLTSGFLIVIGNILQLRSNIGQAFYLFQIGRGTFDTMLAPFIIVLLVSYLMAGQQPWKARAAIALLLVETIALAISFSRNSYLATPFAAMIVMWLGTWEERKRGARRMLAAGFVGFIALTVTIFLLPLLLLMLKAFFLRLLSTQSLGHDLALRERFAEWSGEWLAIKQSPILGHGFGGSFRIFDIGSGYHTWMSFSHSSYLYIIFKTGLIGALLFFVPFFTFLYKGFRLAGNKSLSERSRIVARGCFGCLIFLLFAAFLGPVFDSKTDLMWVGFIWGYFLALERQIQMKATNLDASLWPI